MIRVENYDKIGLNKPAYTLGLRVSADLIDRNYLRWSLMWDDPAVVAFDGDRAVGFISYAVNADNGYLSVEIAGVDRDYRGGARVLIPLLAGLRDTCKKHGQSRIRFGYHVDNPSMKGAVRILRARETYQSAIFDLDDL